MLKVRFDADPGSPRRAQLQSGVKALFIVSGRLRFRSGMYGVLRALVEQPGPGGASRDATAGRGRFGAPVSFRQYDLVPVVMRGWKA